MVKENRYENWFLVLPVIAPATPSGFSTPFHTATGSTLKPIKRVDLSRYLISTLHTNLVSTSCLSSYFRWSFGFCSKRGKKGFKNFPSIWVSQSCCMCIRFSEKRFSYFTCIDIFGIQINSRLRFFHFIFADCSNQYKQTKIIEAFDLCSFRVLEENVDKEKLIISHWD